MEFTQVTDFILECVYMEHGGLIGHVHISPTKQPICMKTKQPSICLH